MLYASPSPSLLHQNPSFSFPASPSLLGVFPVEKYCKFPGLFRETLTKSARARAHARSLAKKKKDIAFCHCNADVFIAYLWHYRRVTCIVASYLIYLATITSARDAFIVRRISDTAPSVFPVGRHNSINFVFNASATRSRD